MTKRYGVIGCGGAGVNRHLSNAMVHPGLSVRAVCDLDEGRANEVASRHGLAAYTDPLEMIESESIDAVSVATPPGTHNELAIDIASTGVDMLIEKPFARRLEQAEAMLSACADHGCAVTGVNNQLFRPTISWANERISSGSIGDVTTVISYVGLNEAGDDDTVKTGWITEIDGQRFGEDFEHRIYLTRNFIGDVTEARLVDAVPGDERIPYATAEATAQMAGERATGYLSMSFHSSCPNVFLVVGTHRSLFVDMSSRLVLTLDKPGGGAELFKGNLSLALEVLTQTARRALIHGRTVALRGLARFGVTVEGAYATSGHYQQLTELARGDQSAMTVTPDDIRNNVMAYERIIDDLAAEEAA